MPFGPLLYYFTYFLWINSFLKPTLMLRSNICEIMGFICSLYIFLCTYIFKLKIITYHHLMSHLVRMRVTLWKSLVWGKCGFGSELREVHQHLAEVWEGLLVPAALGCWVLQEKGLEGVSGAQTGLIVLQGADLSLFYLNAMNFKTSHFKHARKYLSNEWHWIKQAECMWNFISLPI